MDSAVCTLNTWLQKKEHAHVHIRGNGERTQAAWETQTASIGLKSFIENVKRILLYCPQIELNGLFS